MHSRHKSFVVIKTKGVKKVLKTKIDTHADRSFFSSKMSMIGNDDIKPCLTQRKSSKKPLRLNISNMSNFFETPRKRLPLVTERPYVDPDAMTLTLNYGVETWSMNSRSGQRSDSGFSPANSAS